MAYNLVTPVTSTFNLTKDITAFQWLSPPITIDPIFFRLGQYPKTPFSSLSGPPKHTILNRKEHLLRSSKSSHTNRNLNFTVLFDLAFLSSIHLLLQYQHIPLRLLCQVKSPKKSGKTLIFAPTFSEEIACFLRSFSLLVSSFLNSY